MRFLIRCSLILAVSYLFARGLQAATPAPPATPQAPQPAPDPAFAAIADDPALPRVLLIGDSISVGYTLPVRDLLKGKANLHRVPTNAGTTRVTLEHLSEWVGTERWDVIHFNCGLHDLRILPDGTRQVSLEEYGRNLREIVARLRPMANILVWCSTTPVPGTEQEPPRSNADVLAYNALARRIMIEENVLIDDLYTFALPQTDRIRKPFNVHYTAKGYQVLAKQVAASLVQAMAGRDQRSEVRDQRSDGAPSR